MSERPEPTGSRRERVLRVAEELFARRGYAGVGLREIARRAGIRAPSLFKHFPGKRELYNAALRDLFADLLTRIEASIGGDDDYPARLQRLVHTYVDFVLDRPRFPSMFFRVLIDEPRGVDRGTRNLGYEIYRRLEEFLRAGRRSGVFRDVSPQHLWIGFTGAIAAFYGSVPLSDRLAPIDLRSAGGEKRWKREVFDMVSRFVLEEPAAQRNGGGAKGEGRNGRRG